MTKIEAIAHLEKCMKLNPEYRKKWKEYIEIAVMEELDRAKAPKNVMDRVTTPITNRVLSLFDADWWEAQEKNEKPG